MYTVYIENKSIEKRGRTFLENISLKISQNENWVFLGPNGSGKTILGKLILDETKKRTGYVSFEKEKAILDKEREEDETDILNYQDPGTSASEFILQSGGSSSLLKQLAEQFHFSELLSRGLKYLSTGEMRKVIIAESLMNGPDILILDEPYDGMDVQSRNDLSKLLDKLIKDNIQIILLLNRFSEIPDFISHIGYLQNKKLILTGKAEDVLESEELKRLFYFHEDMPESLPESILNQDHLYKGEDLVLMNQIRVAYGEKIVLNDLNWTLKRGEHWKITGPNGVGKSTLLSLISGDNPQAYANDLTLFGMKRGSGETVWDIKKHIGYVSSSFQTDYRVNTSVLLTVISGFYDSIGVYNKYGEMETNIGRQWLKLIKLDRKVKQPLHCLSFGEQRMVLIIRAMVKHPPLLILDEPCQGLDELNRLMVLKLIDIIARESESTVLYVTHHREDHLDSIHKELQFSFLKNSDGSKIQCLELK
ncbi:MAG: molybdate ABC transporter ATP-binding protein ModF [Spirochaetaceae bacterium]|jgi:molybdate transport system ATP-binding protein|nr:molybdate ABC transporter ATP-binding protein ModF [Spirochaetaceae bacterium]